MPLKSVTRSLSAPDLFNRFSTFQPGPPQKPGAAVQAALEVPPSDKNTPTWVEQIPDAAAVRTADFAIVRDVSASTGADTSGGQQGASQPLLAAPGPGITEGKHVTARSTGLLTDHQERQFWEIEAAIIRGDYERLQRLSTSLDPSDLNAIFCARSTGKPLLHTLLEQRDEPRFDEMLTLVLQDFPEATVAPDRQGRIALHLVARQADPDLLQRLLAHTPVVDPGDHQQRTPLHLLARQGAADPAAFARCVELLRTSGADWTLADAFGEDAAGACRTQWNSNVVMGLPPYTRNQLEILRAHPELSADQVKDMVAAGTAETRLGGVDLQRTRLGQSSLYLHHPEKLMDQAAYEQEVDERSTHRMTACRLDRFDRMAKALKGDDIDGFRKLLNSLNPVARQSILSFTGMGRKPLLQTLLQGEPQKHSAELLDLILKACPAAAAVPGDWGQNALHTAAESGHVWAFAPLLQHLHPAEINRRDSLHRHALYWHALRASDMHISAFERGAQLLRQHGADPMLVVEEKDAAGACASYPAASNALLNLPAGHCICMVELQAHNPRLTARDFSQQQAAGMKITRKDAIDALRMADGRQPLYLNDRINREAREDFVKRHLK